MMVNKLYKAFAVFISMLLCFCVQAQVIDNKRTDSLPGNNKNAESNFSGLLKNEKRLLTQSFDEVTGSVKNSAKGILEPITSKIKLLKTSKPFDLNTINLNLDYNYLKDTSLLFPGTANDINATTAYNFNTGVSFFSVPFNSSLNGNNGIYSFDHTPFDNFYKVNFNHKQYVELLENAVMEKINPDLILASITNRINAVRAGYEKQLLNEINDIKTGLSKDLNVDMSLPQNVSDLTISDLSSLKTSLFQDMSMEKYKEELERYNEISKAGNLTGEIQKQVLGSIKKFEALQNIYKRVIEYKDKFENNKLVKELRSHLPFTPENFRSFLQKPGNLKQVIKNYGQLSSIQSLFLSITRLDLGQNPIKNGELSLQDVINTGINTQAQGKKSGGGFVLGASNTSNNWINGGLQSFVSNEYSNLTGLSLNNSSSYGLNQSLSMNVFSFKNSPLISERAELLQSSFFPTAQRQDAVITWASDLSITKGHEIHIDVSKSFGSYSNNVSADSNNYKTGALNSLFKSEGKSNFALAIDYQGEVLNTPVQIIFKNVGLGYNNPGNVFLRRGEQQLGFKASRKLLKQKLSIKYQVDFCNQSFDLKDDYKYITLSNKLKLGYRLKKNNRINLTYHQSDYQAKPFSKPTTKGLNSRLQLDGTYQFRLLNQKVINSLVLSRQKMNLPPMLNSSYQSTSFLFTHSSSLVLNKNIMGLSVMMNRSSNKDYYFNTSFINSEANCSYNIASNLRLTSAIGYYENKGWNTQIGGRQQLSTTVLKKIDFDLEASYKKAIRTIRPELANQVFITTSLNYHF